MPIVKRATGDCLLFWCPGCNELHMISIAQGRWTWNGDSEKPTFDPSVLVRSGHFVEERHKPGDTCWCTFYRDNPTEKPDESSLRFKCGRCHSFVRAGQIQFLDDCSHALKGQTVALPPIPAAYLDA